MVAAKKTKTTKSRSPKASPKAKPAKKKATVRAARAKAATAAKKTTAKKAPRKTARTAPARTVAVRSKENEDYQNFSGKFTVRLPKSLHQALVLRAEREGVSLNLFVTNALSRTVAMPSKKR
ncbi:MAG: type II toxin-antitoxin system HicB family antitoxin [Cyanobacteria bacterium]|nr:type II toxin-antitoxin system HicB family antitoxin [Cyanobacteriota bacterium]